MVPFSCSSDEFIKLVTILGSYMEQVDFDPYLLDHTSMRFLGKTSSGDLRFTFVLDVPKGHLKHGKRFDF